MSGFIRHNSEALKTLRQRGESQTDWEWIRQQEQAGAEPDMSDPDDAEVTEAEFREVLHKRQRGLQKSPVKVPTKHPAFPGSGAVFQGRRSRLANPP